MLGKQPSRYQPKSSLGFSGASVGKAPNRAEADEVIPIKKLGRVFVSAGKAWFDDSAPMWGASISYYAMISLSPLLVIAIAIGGALFGEQAARGEIVEQIGGLIGEESARGIQSLIASARRPESGLVASLVGGATLLFGAGFVFVQLQEALNAIWQVQPKPGVGLLRLLRKYWLSFTMVLGVGFLLLVSLILSAVLAGVGRFVSSLMPQLLILGHIVNTVMTVGVVAGLFAMMFRYLPDVELQWRDVWGGAVVAALLFTVGKSLIGLYLGKSGVSSAYGAAGSLVIILMWVYYTSQIMLYGVEFTKCYKRLSGTAPQPEPHAQRAPHLPQPSADA